MNIDLEQELARLAGSVHDDGAGDRMSGQVRHMVTRVRRRRAARQTAAGAVGVGAVAAIAVGGLQLADRPGAVLPPASPSPEPTPVSESFGTCGSTVTDPAPGVGPFLELDGVVQEMRPPTEDRPATVVVKVDPFGEIGGFTFGNVTLVAAQDGVVVTRPTAPTTADSSLPPSYTFEQPLVGCGDDEQLADGEYELYALQEVVTDDGEETGVLGGPWAIDLGTQWGQVNAEDPNNEGRTAAEQEARMTVNEILSSPVEEPGPYFPQCGVRAADLLDAWIPPVALDLDAPELTVDEATWETTVQLRTTDGRYVIGNASPVATIAVLTQGVVVAYQTVDPEDVTLVDLAAGATQEFPALGTTTICSTDPGAAGRELRLPPGEYQTVAVLDVMLKEVGYPNGDAESVTVQVFAVSEPGTLTIPRP